MASMLASFSLLSGIDVSYKTKTTRDYIYSKQKIKVH